jgi:hypothetical protein
MPAAPDIDKWIPQAEGLWPKERWYYEALDPWPLFAGFFGFIVAAVLVAVVAPRTSPLLIFPLFAICELSAVIFYLLGAPRRRRRGVVLLAGDLDWLASHIGDTRVAALITRPTTPTALYGTYNWKLLAPYCDHDTLCAIMTFAADHDAFTTTASDFVDVLWPNARGPVDIDMADILPDAINSVLAGTDVTGKIVRTALRRQLALA